MIQLTKSATTFRRSAKDLDTMRKTFRRQHWIHLPKFLESQFVHEIHESFLHSRFYTKKHKGIGTELCVSRNPTLDTLRFIVNDPSLFEMIRKITGCGDIGCFNGRIYRLDPEQTHYDSWHDDCFDHRMIALSINLSPTPYRGGALQIRNRKSGKILHNQAVTGEGDAVMFRLLPEIEHRVSKVSGHHSKISFAGWFQSKPVFLNLLKRKQQKRRPLNAIQKR